MAALDDEAGDWACLTEADLEADLLECEEAADECSSTLAARPPASAGGGGPREESLREALRRGLGAKAGAALDSEAFFAAPKALHGVAAELQELLVDVDTLRFEAAALAASIAHGPLRPPASASSTASTRSPAPEEEEGRLTGEAFGLAVPPVKAPPLELSLPAGASGPPDYARRLDALPRSLYIERTVRLCMGEVDKYQDGKDISRDELVVNGAPLSGARGGYAAAVEAIARGLRAGDGGGKAWTPEATEHAAQLLLSVLNRTSSGFAAFEEVLRLFDCPDAVVVSPDSAAARPLEASVIAGCALGRAHTRYAVRGLSGDGAPLAVIDTEFSFRVPTELLQKLAEPGGGDDDDGWGDGWEVEGWASEEIPAAVLLRWSPP